MGIRLFDEADLAADDQPVVLTGRALKHLSRIIEQLASPYIGPGLRHEIHEAHLMLWADPAPSATAILPVGQFTGQIATSLDNNLVFLLDVYVPALPT